MSDDQDTTLSHITLDDCCWPDPRDPRGIEWKLRYSTPTKEDLLVAASYVSAYKTLFHMSQKSLLSKLNAIRLKIKDDIKFNT